MEKIILLVLVIMVSQISANSQILDLINEADVFAKSIEESKFNDIELRQENCESFDFQDFTTIVGDEDATVETKLYYNQKNELLKINQSDKLINFRNRDFYFYYMTDYIIYLCYLYDDNGQNSGDWVDGFFLYNKEDKTNYFFGTREPFVNQYSFKLFELVTIMELDKNLYSTKQLKINDGKTLFKTIYNYKNNELLSEYIYYYLEQPSLKLLIKEIDWEALTVLFKSRIYDNYLGEVKPDIKNKEIPLWTNPLYIYK